MTEERARASACEGKQHVKENKARNLVLIKIKYVEYFEFVKEWVSMCTWWRVSNNSLSFLLETEKGL